MTTATAVPAPKAGVSVIERQGANAQLAHRLMFSAPDDCKFMSLADMRRDADEQRKRSIEILGSSAEMLFATRDGQDYLALGHDDFALTNYAYKQLARNIGLPIETVARLRPETRVRVFNELWQVNRNEGRHDMQFLAEKLDGKLLLRAVTGTRYTRLWDSEVSGDHRQHADEGGLGSGAPDVQFRSEYSRRTAPQGADSHGSLQLRVPL